MHPTSCCCCDIGYTDDQVSETCARTRALQIWHVGHATHRLLSYGNLHTCNFPLTIVLDGGRDPIDWQLRGMKIIYVNDMQDKHPYFALYNSTTNFQWESGALQTNKQSCLISITHIWEKKMSLSKSILIHNLVSDLYCIPNARTSK